MRRTELQRKKELERKGCLHHWRRWRGLGPGVEECVNCGARREAKSAAAGSDTVRLSTLKPGRGFAASKEQREKVRGMACAVCGEMTGEYTVIDPAHICSRGMGGCDDSACVIPLCRYATGQGCHDDFDHGKVDLIAKLEPRFRAEVAHAVLHLGLEGTRRRLAPSLYKADRERAA